MAPHRYFRSNLKVILAVVFQLTTLSIGTVHASPITFAFTGVLSGPIPLFSGSYTFDSQAVDQNPDPKVGFYVSSGGPFGMAFHLGSVTISSDTVQITVTNDQPFPTPTLLADSYLVSEGGSLPNFFFLRDCSGATFNDDHLPLAPPPLSSFRPSCAIGDEVVITGDIGVPGNQVFGQLTSLVKLPEASSLLLVGSGLALLAVLRRRKKPCSPPS